VRALRDAQPLRAARAQAAGTTAPPNVYVVGVLRALNTAGVRYVLVGEVAETLQGSPLLSIGNAVTIVPRAGERDHLNAAVRAEKGQRAASVLASAIDMPVHWTLDGFGAELVVAPAPAATHGYDDLHRDAALTRVGDDVEAEVASLVDLVRITEGGDGQARVPALRRTLELAQTMSNAGDRAA
jgi:hypothetical protein